MRTYILLFGIALFIIGISKIVNLGEIISVWQQIGILLIVAGIFFIAYWIGLNEVR